jgi:hypothetical protein
MPLGESRGGGIQSIMKHLLWENVSNFAELIKPGVQT